MLAGARRWLGILRGLARLARCLAGLLARLVAGLGFTALLVALGRWFATLLALLLALGWSLLLTLGLFLLLTRFLAGLLAGVVLTLLGWLARLGLRPILALALLLRLVPRWALALILWLPRGLGFTRIAGLVLGSVLALVLVGLGLALGGRGGLGSVLRAAGLLGLTAEGLGEGRRALGLLGLLGGGLFRGLPLARLRLGLAGGWIR